MITDCEYEKLFLRKTKPTTVVPLFALYISRSNSGSNNVRLAGQYISIIIFSRLGAKDFVVKVVRHWITQRRGLTEWPRAKTFACTHVAMYAKDAARSCAVTYIIRGRLFRGICFPCDLSPY